MYEHSGQVLAGFFVFTLFLRIIYSRTKYPNDKTVDGEILNKVGYKVEDLELKVNILTYKLQYGCWPMPHQIQKSNFRKNLRNLRLTLSNSNDRNTWIKQVLLSPRRNESYASYSKYCPSEYHVTELFDAKKKRPIYPYLRQENLPMENSSKSSKSSSDKSLNQKLCELPRNKNNEMQYQNTISLPLFSKRKNIKSRRKSYHSSRCIENETMTVACRKFTKTMDDCKRYLRQLHDSNKNLGLICSSSDATGDISDNTFPSDARPQKCATEKCEENINECKRSRVVDSGKRKNIEGADFKETSKVIQAKNKNVDLSNAIYPVLKLIDKHLLSPNMNITFCSNMFPQQSTSTNLIPKHCDRKEFMKSSQKTLYEVKEKLKSLHNMLRMYELQNGKLNMLSGCNSKVNNLCQNGVDILIPATNNKTNGLCTTKRSRVNFKGTRGMQRTPSSSSDQYESDETSKSSIVSIQNYSSVLNTCRSFEGENLSASHDHEVKLIQNNRVVHVSSVKYEKIPERIYYTLSSDSETRSINKDTTILSDLYIEGNQIKSISLSEECPGPIETDEDIVLSPRSSRTEMSKDSELEDKPTAQLLQEALQFKKALLTRVELENVYYIDSNVGEINNGPALERDKYSYINNNLQSKILDIISEEQSVSSSTEKTSRTYMFLNLKQEKQINNKLLNFAQQNEINEITDLTSKKENLNSKQNLTSPSEYFSFSNLTQEEIGTNNELIVKRNRFQEYNPSETIPGNLQLKYLNGDLNKSEENLTSFSNCLNPVGSSGKEPNTYFDYIPQKQSFEEHFTRMNNINEFIYRSINSIELFSENLDELDEEEESSNKVDASNYVNPESLKQYGTLQCNKNKEDVSDSQINASRNTQCVENREIPTASPNLTLKRNPGACSLIEQTQINAQHKSNTEYPFENEAATYNISACESKETSSEVNVIQDSLSSSVNNSNDSNIPEPPSKTVLSNKSLEEEKLDLNWSNVNNDSNDDSNDGIDGKTFSANTITLKKYKTHDDNYKNARVNFDGNEKVQIKQNDLGIQNVDAHLDTAEPANEPEQEYYKSRCNLISAHSSMYFTDEAPSSATKVNNDNLYLKRCSQTRLGVQHNEENKVLNQNTNSRDSRSTNIESMPSECKEIASSGFYMEDLINEFDTKENQDEACNNKHDANYLPSSQVDTEDMNASPRNELNYSKNTDEMLSQDATISRNFTQSNFETNKAERLSMEQYIIWSNVSPRQYSPRDAKENRITKRTSTTVKSRSHENYTPKSEKVRRQVDQQIKGLKADSLDVIQNKEESNINSVRRKSRSSKEDNPKLNKKRSKSQISFRTIELKKEITTQLYESPNHINSINDTQSLEKKEKFKLSPMAKTSSRSCIPILKSRLEAARKSENESRPKSPMRGPLTMTMFCRDDLCEKNQNLEENIQVEGKSKHNELCMNDTQDCVKKTSYNHKQDSSKLYHCNFNQSSGSNNNTQEQMVIYVNIFTKYDHNTTKIVDPNKFLECMKNRNISTKKAQENQNNEKNIDVQYIASGNESNSIGNIVTVVSSVINGNELNQTTSANLSASKKQNNSLGNNLLHSKIKNLYFLSVEQREIDVTAKPSVIDTSTSISDLENISEKSNTLVNKFQICGTPKELNNEEYIALLEILQQERNFVHLQELQNVCTKLVSEHRRPN